MEFATLARARFIALALASGLAIAGCRASLERPRPARAVGGSFRVIAHRGASGYAPENTLAAFQKAFDLGAREVELDVQLTRDDQVIVFHDRRLDEKTSERGPVSARSLDELRRIDIGTWFDARHPESTVKFAGTRLASLAEVFAAFGARLAYQIELKGENPALADRVLGLISRAHLERRVMISSSRVFLLDRVRALDASMPIVLLIGDQRELRAAAGTRGATADLARLQREWIDRAAQSRFDEVALPAEELTAADVLVAHAKGLQIGAYRVRSKEEMDRVFRVSADAMTINWPDWAVERLRKSSGGPRM